MKSQYIVYPEKEKVDLWEEEIAPPEEGEILCQAEKSLISIGTELHALRGVADPGTNWYDWLKFPFRPGYSMVGRVIGVGKGVTHIKEGDRVASYGYHQQYYKIKLFDVTRRHDIPEGFEVYVLPDGISSEDGTWRSLAVTTQNALRRGSFQFGESAVVVGLGILGQLVTQYLAAAGAQEVIVVDPAAHRLELAHRHGANHTLQMPVQQAIEEVKSITKGSMADMVFDVTGHPATLAPCIELVRRFGRLVLLGDTPTPSEQRLGPGVVFNAIAILGIHGYAVPERTTEFTPWTVDTMSRLFFHYLMQGKMNVADLVTHRVTPAHAPQTYLELLADRSGALGVIIDWSGMQ